MRIWRPGLLAFTLVLALLLDRIDANAQVRISIGNARQLAAHQLPQAGRVERARNGKVQRRERRRQFVRRLIRLERRDKRAQRGSTLSPSRHGRWGIR